LFRKFYGQVCFIQAREETLSKRIVVGIVSALLLIGVFSLAFNIQPAQSEAHTIIVPDDYPTIQAAINAANAGDTVYVKNGTYIGYSNPSEYLPGYISGAGVYLPVYVNKTVALVGESRDSTIIYGVHSRPGGSGIALIVSADNATITGFTLNAGADSDSSQPALLLSNVKGVNVSGLNLNGPRYGAVLAVESVSNSTFSGLSFSWPDSEHGYALSLASSSFNTFFANNLYGCQISSSSNNLFFGNNIGGARAQGMSLDASSINNWNGTYPSGGNYWGGGVDLKTGSNQDQPGHDGIVDTPYVMNSNNTDYYPLMRPYVQLSAGIPFAHFNYTQNKLAGETVTFDASDSYDLNGNIVNYAWDFGDGVNATSASPVATHAYGNAQPNTVKLTVTDNDGLTDTITQTVTVGMVSTSLSLFTSSSSMFTGFKVDVAGTLRDVYGNGLNDKTIVLSYTVSGISTWTPITSCTTDNAGNYLATWIPTATGTFTLKVEWSGTSTVSAANNATTLNCLSYDQYVFSVESNSTISNLAFNAANRVLSFTATGADGTKGYVRATVAKNFAANPAGVKVLIDGNQVECSPTSTSDSCLLYFTYQHSTHTVLIDLSAAAQPTPTPTPSPTATPTPTPTPNSTQTPQPTPTPTPTSSPTSQPTSTPTPTPTPTQNPTATPQPGENPFTNWMLYLIPAVIAIVIIALILAWKRKKLNKPQTA
jgi:PKD repeat protein